MSVSANARRSAILGPAGRSDSNRSGKHSLWVIVMSSSRIVAQCPVALLRERVLPTLNGHSLS